MTVTTVPAPTHTQLSRAQILRIALVAVAVVVLLGAAFVLGRVTNHTASPAAHATPIATPIVAAPVTTTGCRLGRPC
jgi:hypothetical protein